MGVARGRPTRALVPNVHVLFYPDHGIRTLPDGPSFRDALLLAFKLHCSSSLLNLLTLALPWQIVVVRMATGAILVFPVAPLAVRLVGMGEMPSFAMPLSGAQADESSIAPAEVDDGATITACYLRAVVRLDAFLLIEYFIFIVAKSAFNARS